MLDELSMGLAPIVVDELYNHVAQLAAEGITVVVVEQFARTALSVATSAMVMANGRIIQTGTVPTWSQCSTRPILGSVQPATASSSTQSGTTKPDRHRSGNQLEDFDLLSSVADDTVQARGIGLSYRAGAGSNGPRPIWSRTVITVGFVKVRRCQLAPSTTRVCPEMNLAKGEARKVAAQPNSCNRPTRSAGWQASFSLVRSRLPLMSAVMSSWGKSPGTSPFT